MQTPDVEAGENNDEKVKQFMGMTSVNSNVWGGGPSSGFRSTTHQFGNKKFNMMTIDPQVKEQKERNLRL